MNLSITTKVLFGLGALVALFAYLLLLDFGVNAGRVHYGVSVDGFDVGGLTKEEAREVLAEHGRELKTTEVIFTREGFNCIFVPRELGWRARPIETAERARHVGLDGGAITAFRDRVKAWFGGVEISWAGGTNHEKVDVLVRYCRRQAKGLGQTLRSRRFRKKVAAAIVTWPRRPFTIPVEQS